MASLRVYLYLLVLFVEISSSYGMSTCLPEKQAALFVFGDSLFDAGINNFINTTSDYQATFPPYGQTFFHYPNGRFSDGRVIPDFIAEHAKLPLIFPYMHPDVEQYYMHGVNFASGGSGALVETARGFVDCRKIETGVLVAPPDKMGPQTPLSLHIDQFWPKREFVQEFYMWGVVDLNTQVSYYKSVSNVLRKKLGNEEAEALLSRSVHLFSDGSNDYGARFSSKSSVLLHYSTQQFVDIVIGNLTNAIKEIHNLGGRKFAFVNIGPIGCTPIIRYFEKGNKCNNEMTEAARLHNVEFPRMLQKLEKQLHGFKYSVFDFYTSASQVMNHPSKYGFKEGQVACCGGGPYRGDDSCGGKRGIRKYELCENASDYVFFDSPHPTDRANQYFSSLMWSGNLTFNQPYNMKQLFEF